MLRTVCPRVAWRCTIKPGQTDYTEAQKVYAKVTAPSVYTFDLGGQWVTGLRIDRQRRRRADAFSPV